MNLKTLALLSSLSVGLLGLPGCTTSQARYSLLDKAYPPKPGTYDVEVLRDGPPARAFTRIARLDVHIERTYFVSTNFDEALPQLKEQARRAGADAIIDIVEKQSTVGEAKVYHVTASGIRYNDAP